MYLPTFESSLADVRVWASCLVDSSEPFIFQLPPTKKVRAILTNVARDILEETAVGRECAGRDEIRKAASKSEKMEGLQLLASCNTFQNHAPPSSSDQVKICLIARKDPGEILLLAHDLKNLTALN